MREVHGRYLIAGLFVFWGVLAVLSAIFGWITTIPVWLGLSGFMLVSAELWHRMAEHGAHHYSGEEEDAWWRDGEEEGR